MPTIGELAVVLTAVTGPFTRAVQGVAGGLSGLRSAVFSVQGAMSGLVGVMTTGAFALWVKSSLDAGDALAKQADSLGIGTQRLQAFQHAADLAGVSHESLANALNRMQKTTGDAALGLNKAVLWLDRLGLSVTDLAGKRPDEQFTVFAMAIKNLGDRSQQAAATQAIFGDATGRMLNFLDAGMESIDQAGASLDRYGVSLSRIDAAKMESANDAITEAQTALSGIANQAALHLAPLIEVAATKFTDLVARAGGFAAVWDGVVRFFVTGMGYVLDAGQGLLVFWRMAQYGAAVLVESVINGAASMVEVWQELSTRSQQVWNVISASASLAWAGVQHGATVAVQSAIISFERLKQAFGTMLQNIGRAAADSRIEGIAELGLETEFAGTRLIGQAGARMVEARQAIEASAQQLATASQSLDQAWQQMVSEPPATPTGLEDLQAGSSAAVAAREADLVNTVRSERWSAQLTWETQAELAAIQQRAELKAEAVAQQQQAETTTLDETLRNQLADRLAKLQEGLRSESEQLALKLADDLTLLQASYDARLLDEATYQALRAQLIADNQAKIEEIQAQAAQRQQARQQTERDEWLKHQDILTQSWYAGLKQREQFNQQHWSVQLAGLVSNLQQMTAQMASHNKTMFRIHQAVSIANAVINTAQGVTQALAAYPPPISFIMAAAQAAVGALQIATIARQKWDGGSANAPSVSGGRGAPTATEQAADGRRDQAEPPARSEAAGLDRQPEQAIYIQATSPKDLITVQTLQELFQQAVEGNYRIAGIRFAP